MNSIDFSRSRAILIGTAKYSQGLEQMPAARNSLVAMRELLVGPLCGWPLNRVTLFEDKTTRDGLNQQIAELIHETTDVLLLYYVGHGQLLDGEHLGLALVDTHKEPKMRYSTSLRMTDLRTELKYGCNARVKLLILDCCFSGIDTKNTQGTGLADQVQVATKVEGAYTLTASRASQKAIYQDGGTGLTYFTKIFDEIVRDGIPGAGAELTLKDIHKEVAARFLRLELSDGQLRPEPSVLAIDTAEELAFARNVRAAQTASVPLPSEPDVPLVQPPPAHLHGVKLFERLRMLINAVSTPSTPTAFDVVLVAAGLLPTEVVQVVHRLTKLDPQEAQRLVDRAPCVVLAGVDRVTAVKAEAKLMVAGATATLRRASPPDLAGSRTRSAQLPLPLDGLAPPSPHAAGTPDRWQRTGVQWLVFLACVLAMIGIPGSGAAWAPVRSDLAAIDAYQATNGTSIGEPHTAGFGWPIFLVGLVGLCFACYGPVLVLRIVPKSVGTTVRFIVAILGIGLSAGIAYSASGGGAILYALIMPPEAALITSECTLFFLFLVALGWENELTHWLARWAATWNKNPRPRRRR